MIELRGIHKRLGEFRLEGVDLAVGDGEYVVILGPTGAGKTVLLEVVAGIHAPDRGEVWLKGQPANHLPPERRSVAYVPQDYVLFSHMSLRANIEFPLRLRRAPREMIDERVDRLATTLRIEKLLSRRPRTLSGGEQQRGALARALSWSPDLLLLDEPLSALDEGTRADLTAWLRATTEEFGTSVIHVCHNFEEALDLADRVAVLRDGRVLQEGRPTELLRRPGTEFLARFMGGSNLLAVDSWDEARCEALLAGGVRLAAAAPTEGHRWTATVRPEDVEILPAEESRDPQAGSCLTLRLAHVTDRGRQVRLRVEGELGLDVALTPQAFRAARVREGDTVRVRIPRDAVHLIPVE